MTRSEADQPLTSVVLFQLISKHVLVSSLRALNYYYKADQTKYLVSGNLTDPLLTGKKIVTVVVKVSGCGFL